MGLFKKLKSKSVIAFNKVDEGAGKKFFGNTTGVVNNLTGRSKLNTSIDENLKNENPELYHLKKHGFTKYENNYKKELVERLSEKFDRLIEDEKTSFPSSGFKGHVYQRVMKNPEKIFPELAELITKDVREFNDGYYKTNYKIKYILCVRNYPVPKEIRKEREMFANFWHMDNRNSSELKFFVYLSDVTEKDGPFHVQSKERTKELIKLGFGNRDHYDLPLDVLEDPNHVKKMTGPKGTTLYGNVTVCLHRAGDPDEGHQRDMVQIFLVPSEKPFSDDWINDVEEYTDLNFYNSETDTKIPITEYWKKNSK